MPNAESRVAPSLEARGRTAFRMMLTAVCVDLPFCYGDWPLRDRLQLLTIFVRLVVLLLQRTARGRGSVRVDVAPDGDPHHFVMGVSDTGIGITPDQQKIIFDAFRRADGSIRRKFGGFGLGLHIVQRRSELPGGTVAVDSDLGRGATFTVRLPCEPTGAPSAAGHRQARSSPVATTVASRLARTKPGANPMSLSRRRRTLRGSAECRRCRPRPGSTEPSG